MKNPFRYGVPVSGDYYFPRPDFSKKLSPYTLSGQKILLYGRRRFGKTSFLKEYSDTLKEKGSASVFVDVYPITSLRDFLHALSAGIKESGLLSTTDRMKGIVFDLFRTRPRLAVEGDSTSLDFFIPSLKDDDVKSAIEDTIRLFGKIAEAQPIVVVFDEFQKIAEIDDAGWLEGTLRSEIQKQEAVPYIFCGSRRGLILDMFQNSSRPFYQMCTAIELPRLQDDFAKWLRTKLLGAKVAIDSETSLALLDKINWSPNYAQMIAFHLVADPPEGNVSVDDIERVLDALCQLNGYTYMTLYDSLGANAQRLLRLVAKNPGQSPFRQELMATFDLRTSGVQSAIRSLINRHILDDTTSGGNVYFDDPLFSRWLKTRLGY
ncbi:MAG: ATP-binding protein [Pseudomonadota bacterium]